MADDVAHACQFAIGRGGSPYQEVAACTGEGHIYHVEGVHTLLKNLLLIVGPEHAVLHLGRESDGQGAYLAVWLLICSAPEELLVNGVRS